MHFLLNIKLAVLSLDGGTGNKFNFLPPFLSEICTMNMFNFRIREKVYI